ncbi:MAG: AAA family ATPase [Planctomycetota bacterium]
MKLIWFEVEGYKRFFEKSKINLDGKLVAIVGPNEAGKTSLLRCLHHFNKSDAFTAVGGSQEISRGKSVADDAVIAEWTFALDDSDRQQLSEIPNSECVRWYVIKKSTDGSFIHHIAPVPERSLAERSEMVAELRQLVASEDSPGVEGDDQTTGEPSAMMTLIEALDTKDPMLSEGTLEALENLGERLSNGSDESDVAIGSRLLELHKLEELSPPKDRVLDYLWKNKPSILFFAQGDRDLRSEYDIKKYFYENRAVNPPVTRQTVPTALHNLGACAGLKLQDLYEAQLNDDRGRVRTLLEAAEDTMNAKLVDAWTQSTLTLSLELDQYRLQILLKSHKGDYVKVVERSDGLRQFIALVLFLSKWSNKRVKPIVLIDEAEVHLHYDAQADLVQTLARQDLAAKVIYTTHSVGCLPEDLGSGVRMVAVDEPHSTIENWFWNTDRPGFSPLLFALGASTLAFVPMRYSVVGEGAADMILVPALLKQGLGLDSLGFQVVPGLSSANADQVAVIDNESTRTIYLVDGDKAGSRMRAKLLSSGVGEDRIVGLPHLDGEETVIEDYVATDVYVRSVNEDIAMSGGVSINESDVLRPNRPKKIEMHCAANDCSVPSKRAVAYRVVEAKYEHQIVDSAAADALNELHERICRALKLG